MVAAPVLAARGFSAATGLAAAFASSSARLKSVQVEHIVQGVLKGEHHTLEHQALALDRFVAVRLGLLDLHDLAVHFESVHLLHSLERCLLAVKHNKRLALALQAALRNDIEDRSVVFEDSL